jgi:hypothetical protein
MNSSGLSTSEGFQAHPGQPHRLHREDLIGARRVSRDDRRRATAEQHQSGERRDRRAANGRPDGSTRRGGIEAG